MPQQRSKPTPRSGGKHAGKASAAAADDRKEARSDGRTFRPVKTRRIFEEICDAIREKLVSGELKAGDRLPSERELSEMLDVSRTALREAIRTLEIAGIVEMRKGSKGGAFITESGVGQVTRTFSDMLDFGRVSLATLLEARLLVMDAVVRSACERASAADIERLSRNVAETVELTRQGRYEERTLKAVQFSTLLANSTGNQVMSAILEAMASVIRRFVLIAGPPAHDPVIASRLRLIEQIKAKDTAGACETMRSYLTKLNDHLLNTEKARLRNDARRRPRALA
ncbi:MAG: FadR family transcriptional regulator [Rhizobiales bacterium]|nr:FadR family transcriptional regulator [Hyphomicrobiales bacterium]